MKRLCESARIVVMLAGATATALSPALIMLAVAVATTAVMIGLYQLGTTQRLETP